MKQGTGSKGREVGVGGGGEGGGCRRKSQNPYPPRGPEASAKGGTVSLEVRSIC